MATEIGTAYIGMTIIQSLTKHGNRCYWLVASDGREIYYGITPPNDAEVARVAAEWRERS